MIRRSLAVIAAVLCVTPTLAADDSAASAVTQLNTLLQRATERFDGATLASLVTDDYALVPTNGALWNRTQFLTDAVDRSISYELNEPEEVTVRTYNDDCAIVIAVLHVRYRKAGVEHDVRLRYTDTWVKLDGQWRYASGQATSLKSASS